MPAADPTSWDPLFKDDYSPEVIENSLAEENNIQNFMVTDVADDTWQGRRKVIPKLVGRNWSIGSIPVRGRIPNQGRSTYVDSIVGMRNLYGSVGFGRDVMIQSRNKKGSWKEVVAQEMSRLVEDFSFVRNRIAWADGRGILARCNGIQTGVTTLELKDPLNVPGSFNANRYIHGDALTGMSLCIVDSGTFAIKGFFTVTAYNADGTDITTDVAVTCADGDYVVVGQSATQSSYNLEPEGLLAGIDDGTYVATYHGLARATYPLEKAYVLTGVGPLSLDALQQPIDATDMKVGGGVPDVIASNHGFRAAYLALLEPDRRYTGADLMRPDGGTAAAKRPSGKKGKAITFGDIPFFTDRDGPDGMAMGIKKDTWVRYVAAENGWGDEGGGVMKWVDGYDEYMAFYYLFENYHCFVPPRNWRMEGVTTRQLLVHAA
jgi:hypothetical protein